MARLEASTIIERRMAGEDMDSIMEIAPGPANKVPKALLASITSTGNALEALWGALPQTDGGNRNRLQGMFVDLQALARSHNSTVLSDVFVQGMRGAPDIAK